jgi:hypothetical protein
MFKDYFRKIKRFIFNTWTFRKELSNYQWWDYHYTLEMFKKCLDQMSDNLELKGIEVDSSRLKKVKKMRRASELINNFLENNHLFRVQEVYGEFSDIKWDNDENNPELKIMSKSTDNDRKILDETRKLEEQEWDELWEIIKGQDPKNKKKNEDWDKWYDGSGMLGWWD